MQSNVYPRLDTRFVCVCVCVFSLSDVLFVCVCVSGVHMFRYRFAGARLGYGGGIGAAAYR